MQEYLSNAASNEEAYKESLMFVTGILNSDKVVIDFIISSSFLLILILAARIIKSGVASLVLTVHSVASSYLSWELSLVKAFKLAFGAA